VGREEAVAHERSHLAFHLRRSRFQRFDPEMGYSILVFAWGGSLSYWMIPSPYEPSRGFVRSFIHLGSSKHSFQEVSCTIVEHFQRTILSFSFGAGPCSHSILVLV
jgi:hypothetical protein